MMSKPDEMSITELDIKQQKIDHVFCYYDEPKLYSCWLGLDSRYLVVESEETQDKQVWLYVSISEAIYNAMIQGQVSLYSVFKDSEYLYKVIINSCNKYQIIKLKSSEIGDNLLPDKCSRITMECFRSSRG
ncbi:MAG: DUF6575 domain-containing protein [Gammaproteobacteria bacterium]